jgi:hypothetical protein
MKSIRFFAHSQFAIKLRQTPGVGFQPTLRYKDFFAH